MAQQVVRELDTPDGLRVNEIITDEGGPGLSFYTGRWDIEFDKKDVAELVEKLKAWLEGT